LTGSEGKKSNRYFYAVSIRIEHNTFVIAVAGKSWFAGNFVSVVPEFFSQSVYGRFVAY
jgi:hypothetical protein